MLARWPSSDPPKARRELVEIFLYLAEHASPETAQRLRRAARETLQQLAESPDIGSPCKIRRQELSGVRMWRVCDFQNYLIFYIPESTGILVERVIHSKQDYTRLIQ